VLDACVLGDASPAPDDAQPFLVRLLGSERVVVALVVGVLLLVASVGVAAVLIHDASKPIGTPISSGDRAAVQRATCAQLAVLFNRYQGGADSVEPDITVYRLVTERMKTLGCTIPATSSVPTSNLPGGPP
jgi:hypothetical protein